MIPRLGERIARAERYTMRPGAYVILPRDGQVLLTVQWGDAPDVQFPGGGIDPGEQVLPALYREVLEETGWTIGRPRRLGAYRRFVYMPEYDLWAEKLCRIYVARPARAIADPSEPNHSAIWVPTAAVPSVLCNASDRAFFLRHFGQGSPE